tara:strand:- start:771 stop:1031 length:261 start_codon:yes stop_codon:yes gene_type:complete
MRDRDHQGYASSGAFDLPKMSKAAKVKCVGRISIAELQARNGTRHKRKPKKERVPDYVMKNKVKRWAKHKGVDTQERGGYTIIKLG